MLRETVSLKEPFRPKRQAGNKAKLWQVLSKTGFTYRTCPGQQEPPALTAELVFFLHAHYKGESSFAPGHLSLGP